MRLLLAFLALFLVAALPLPGTSSSTLAPDTEARWVPFDLTPGNQIRFDLTIDGRPAVAILDTGVSASVVSRAFAANARLRVQPRGSATAIGGAVAIGWTTTHDIAFGGLVRRGGGLTVTSLPASATLSDRPVDMLVGHDLIDGYALDIDYAASRFRLLPSGRLPFRGASAPLAVSPEQNLYVTQLTLGGRRLQPVVVDTGDGSSITLSQQAWRSTRLAPMPMTTTIAYGIGGAQITELAIVDALSVGRLGAEKVELRIEPNGGFSQSIGAAGRIGSGFLQRYRVLIDPGAGHIVFSEPTQPEAGPLRSTSGILARTEKDRLRVLHVMRGSPAESGGWRSGETICSIDGTAIGSSYATSRAAGWSVDRPGRVVALGLCDGVTRRLTLQRFY
ncbi:MAG: hypothetical protein B7Y45_09545 [Sphingomonas sp. 28-66-16]|nr:MAG: hypothetical protein B7Y45_09545 [Sphingomonas sp. 28-66-16]